MRLFLHQVLHEQLIFWRSREAAIFIFVFPPMLFLLLGSVYDGTIDGHPAASVLLVGMLGYGAANTAFAGLTIQLVLRRENALLKRLRATPLPAATYLAAVLASVLLVFALQAVTLELLGIGLFDAQGPESPAGFVLALAFAAAVFAGIGLGAASLIRSAEGSSAVVNVILLPMAFLSGSFGPTDDYPQFLQAIGAVLPLKYVIELLSAAALDGIPPWERPGDAAIAAVWGAAGLLVAGRRFRWEPVEG